MLFLGQLFLGRPRDILPAIFSSNSCNCDVLCLIRYPRYCHFLVLNCRTISLPVILLNTSSLVIVSVHNIFNTLRYIHISKASSLDIKPVRDVVGSNAEDIRTREIAKWRDCHSAHLQREWTHPGLWQQ